MLDPAAGEALLSVAVRAVEEPLRAGRRWLPQVSGLPVALARPGACFVTLRRNGVLLGCIGSLVAHRPLGVDVAHNAAAAAFDDPRLPAVTTDDLAEMDVHISVLRPLEPVAVTSRRELVEELRPGVDGVLVEDARHRATFLPSVWAQIGDRATSSTRCGSRPGCGPASGTGG